MSMFDTKANHSICVLPWVHEFKHLNNKIAPCCQAQFLKDNETMEMVREQMLAGIKPDSCKVCYKMEEHTNYSSRIKETIDWIKKFGEPKIDHPSLEFIDLRFDATCNLKCKTCGPLSSTLWQKEKKIKYPQLLDTKKYFESVDKSKLKKVYLAGGEPTFIPAYLDFLNELYAVNKDCEIMINTNLKRLSNPWKRIMSKFKNCTVICSCDAINELGCYVRYPLDWQQFTENVQWASENVNYLMFNLVASNLTIHKIKETCDWMTQYSKAVNLNILSEPECFTIQAIPNDFRKTYKEQLEKIKKHPLDINFVTQFRSEVDMLLQILKQDNHDPVLTKALKKEIIEQDSHRSTKLADVDPFLHSWVYR